jgi:hypothetical protein
MFIFRILRTKLFEKMTPQEFKSIWTSTGGILSPLTSTRLMGLNLKPRTMEFLTQAGLPHTAAPFLSFVDNSDDKYKGIARLTEQFDFLEEQFKKWIVIGSCGDGDQISINVDSNDQICWLDHENYYEAGYFNSSIETLAESIVSYRDFVLDAQRENGADTFFNGNFSDIQFETLKSKLLKADNRAFVDNGFWKERLEMDLAVREHNRKQG